jgi:hypothetical protein
MLVGCAEESQNRKQTSTVSGTISVDGIAPGSPVKVGCESVNGLDEKNPTVSWCMTDPDGAFSISTYEQGDGVPAGDYALTFVWGEMNPISMSYGGEDKLGGRYDTQEKSPTRFTVSQGKPVDLGVVALTTK